MIDCRGPVSPDEAFTVETTMLKIMSHEAVERLVKELSADQRVVAKQLQLGKFFSQSMFDEQQWAPTKDNEKSVYFRIQILPKKPNQLIPEDLWFDLVYDLFRHHRNGKWRPKEVRIEQRDYKWKGTFYYEEQWSGTDRYQIAVRQLVRLS